MKKKILSFVCVLAMVFSLMPVSASAGTTTGTDTTGDVYVLMNIPYDEFYKAETTGNQVKVDAFTSATKAKTRTGSLAGGSYHENDTGEEITGVIYPVKLGDGVTLETVEGFGGEVITDASRLEITTTNRGQTSTVAYEGYKALFEAPSYSYYLLAETPPYYKELTVGEDGAKAFGEALGDVTEVPSSSTFTTQTTYGDYQLNLDEALLEGYFDHAEDLISGVVITATDGTGYGLRHMENIWLGYELAWCTGFTDAVHNCPTSSDHYKSMMGKTIDYVTYYTDKGIFKFDIEDTYVPKKFDYTLEVSADDEEQKATIALSGLDNAEGYTAEYAVDGESVTLDENNAFSTDTLKPGTHQLVVNDITNEYADLSTSFVVSTQNVVAAYDESQNTLVAATGYSAEDLSNYVNNITKVTVNDTEYLASGRGSVTLINKDGSLVTDAEVFAEEGTYSVIVTSTGYNDFAFEYVKEAVAPSASPSAAPSAAPSASPSASPSVSPSAAPSVSPTSEPGNTNSGTDQVAVAKVKSVKVSGSSKKIKVSWKKISGVSGYQIQYSTSKKFKKSKTVSVKKAKTVKTTIKKGLKKGKKYYVRVRAYKTVNGKKKTGNWSVTKTVKVK